MEPWAPHCRIRYDWHHYRHQHHGWPSNNLQPCCHPQCLFFRQCCHYWQHQWCAYRASLRLYRCKRYWFNNDRGNLRQYSFRLASGRTPLTKDSCWDVLGQRQGEAWRGLFAHVCPNFFFGQKTIKSSVHNPDFEDQFRAISPTHFQWAKLIKERLTQEENDSEDLDLVINHLSKSRNKADTLKMVISGLEDIRVSDSTFLSVFTLPSEKWSLHQEKLRDFFVGNPSPVKNNRPHFQVCFKASGRIMSDHDFSPRNGFFCKT